MNIQEMLANLRAFSFPFARYALVVVVLVSLCAALLGVLLVLKRYSMIGDGLSHVAFGAGAISAVFASLIGDRLVDMIFGEGSGAAKEFLSTAIVLVITVAIAILLLRTKNGASGKGDSAIAMLSAGSLSVGYLLLNLTETNSSNLSGDVCTSLFGSTSILMLSRSDVLLCLGLSAAVILVFILLYNRIFSVTFDEKFARANGTKVDRYNLIIAIASAVVIVAGMKLAGALLISALIIFPAMTAMKIFGTFRKVIISSAVISVFCSFFGTVIAILLGAPVGACVVVINILLFGISSVISWVRQRR